jgi:hypothetical protein
VSVMARLLLQRAVRPGPIDEIFEAHRGLQSQRELLCSTVVEIMTLVSVGLCPAATSRTTPRARSRVASPFRRFGVPQQVQPV